MKDKVEFRKLREFGELIGDTFLFMKQNFKPLMKSFFALTGIFIVGGIISSMLAQLQLVGIAQAAGTIYDDSPRNMIYNVGFTYFLSMVFVLLTYTSMYVSILSFIALYIEKGNIAPTVDEVWAYFKYYFFRMMGSGVLLVIFFMLCFILCIVPGIYVYPALTIFAPIMILENGSFTHSFDRSFKLLKEKWWITAAVILVINLIFYAFSTMVQLPAIIIMMVGAFTQGERTITNVYAVISSISQQISYIFMIIPIICSSLIYFNLVERKENLGLFQRMDSLGQSPETDQTIQEEY
ncbi:hypothetical protein [Pedobacter cryotolerans]|uniref:Glycerophosphoryl diester phosphodiesterase membrane domain-containing protein n=1 Tax=Pedobacter cryotolerans TaxID=2571270 RepID=A0A4U1CBH6_9SPHI|nr:hypothetical protein [Pedobacter cryotolerans]TKC03365.1 hypothetical protein FA045_02005 [Pedobacter cryotolerans]